MRSLSDGRNSIAVVEFVKRQTGGLAARFFLMQLEPPDSHFLSAAEGWLMLNAPAEALAECRSISEANSQKSCVLEVLWQAHCQLKQWERCLEIVLQLCQRNPKNHFAIIHRSFSLHELKRTQEAFDLLLPALQLFPEESLIPYNLACYSCQLGQMTDAMSWFAVAVQLGGRDRIVGMGLEDTDLAPLHLEIQKKHRKPG